MDGDGSNAAGEQHPHAGNLSILMQQADHHPQPPVPNPTEQGNNDDDDMDTASLRSSLKDPNDDDDNMSDAGSLRSSSRDPNNNDSMLGQAGQELESQGARLREFGNPRARAALGDEPVPSETEDPEAARIFPKTFGIELEFLIVCDMGATFYEDVLVAAIAAKTTWEMQRLTHETAIADQARRGIVAALRGVGIQTNNFEKDGGKMDDNKWTVATDGSVTERGELYEGNSELILGSGRRIALTDDVRQRIYFANVEVKSRILPATMEALKELKLAVRTIQSLNTLVNESCGLHCHVGQGPHGFDLRTLKNFMLLTSLAEPLLLQIHPSHRLDNEFCIQQSVLFEPDERTPEAMYRRIEGFTSVMRLIKYMHTSPVDRRWILANPDFNGILVPYNAYNLMNLQAGMGRQTVEFRGAAGSLDDEAVLRWALFCINIMQKSQARGHPFNQALRRLAEPGFGLFQLLQELEFDELALLYLGHTFEHTGVEIRDPRLSDEVIAAIEAAGDPEWRNTDCDWPVDESNWQGPWEDPPPSQS